MEMMQRIYQGGMTTTSGGNLSIRDEKDPQIVINRARPISDYAEDPRPEPEQPAPAPVVPAAPVGGTLYLKLTGESDPRYRKVRAILNMFPGDSTAVVYFADTKQRRGSRCSLDDRMLRRLTELLGEENVVVK